MSFPEHDNIKQPGVLFSFPSDIADTSSPIFKTYVLPPSEFSSPLVGGWGLCLLHLTTHSFFFFLNSTGLTIPIPMKLRPASKTIIWNRNRRTGLFDSTSENSTVEGPPPALGLTHYSQKQSLQGRNRDERPTCNYFSSGAKKKKTMNKIHVFKPDLTRLPLRKDRVS